MHAQPLATPGRRGLSLALGLFASLSASGCGTSSWITLRDESLRPDERAVRLLPAPASGMVHHVPIADATCAWVPVDFIDVITRPDDAQQPEDNRVVDSPAVLVASNRAKLRREARALSAEAVAILYEKPLAVRGAARAAGIALRCARPGATPPKPRAVLRELDDAPGDWAKDGCPGMFDVCVRPATPTPRIASTAPRPPLAIAFADEVRDAFHVDSGVDWDLGVDLQGVRGSLSAAFAAAFPVAAPVGGAVAPQAARAWTLRIERLVPSAFVVSLAPATIGFYSSSGSRFGASSISTTRANVVDTAFFQLGFRARLSDASGATRCDVAGATLGDPHRYLGHGGNQSHTEERLNPDNIRYERDITVAAAQAMARLVEAIATECGAVMTAARGD